MSRIKLRTTDYERLHHGDTIPANATNKHHHFVGDLCRDITTLQAEVARLADENASLLAAQAPRPVPEGDRVMRNQWVSGVAERFFDEGADAEEAMSDAEELFDAAVRIGHPNLAARIEALEAENARLMACVKAAGLVGLTITVESPEHAAQSTPRPTVDSGAPSGLDETKEPPGKWMYDSDIANGITEVEWWTREEVCVDTLAEAWTIAKAEAEPFICAATATLVAERDAVADRERDRVAAIVKRMWDECSALGPCDPGQTPCSACMQLARLLGEVQGAPAGPRAEREQADGG